MATQRRQDSLFVRRKVCLAIALLLLINPLIPLAHADISQKESKIRTAIVLGLLRFANWPDEKHPTDQITLCDSGYSVTAKTINKLRKIPKIGKFSVNSVSLDSSIPLEDCHAVLIGKESPELKLTTKSVLAICDDCEPPFIVTSAINLKRKDNLIQFEINMDLVEEQNIKLSATVLELASKCSSSNPAIRGCND